jgi:excisionase family DNA binding protein
MEKFLTPEEITQLLAKEFLTPEEVAKIMRLNKKTIYTLLNSGKLPGKKWGNQWRIHSSELQG